MTNTITSKNTRTVPKLRFAEFPLNLMKLRLGNIVSFKSGGTPSMKNTSFWGGDVTWISASSMVEKYLYQSKRTITEEGLKRGSKLAKKGTLLLLVRGSMLYNKVPIAITGKDVAFNQDIKALQLKDTVLVEYMFQWFSVKQNLLMNKVVGTGIGAGKLATDTLQKLEVSLPSLPEQQKIASFLTAVDQKLAQLTQKKTLLEQYKKGTMQQLFLQELRFKAADGSDFPEWEEKRLGDVLKYYDGTHQTPKYFEKGIPFYSVEHVTANQFSSTKFISNEVFEKENKRVKLERGDILMTRIGDIGTSRLIDWEVNASFYVSLALLKHNDSFNSRYLNQYISSVYFQKELWAKTIHVAFPKKINLGEIGNCKIKLPSLPEQQKIATFLSALDAKIETVAQQIATAQTFKKGLLQQLFV